MRLVIQRVKQARVSVSGEIIGRIGSGLLVFIGIAKTDTRQNASHLAQKTVELRIFEDANGKMNLSAAEARAGFLVVSQFTLCGNCDKGRRPSFDDAADPALGEELYNHFIVELKKHGLPVETGKFRAMMDVELINDGPVTFIVDG